MRKYEFTGETKLLFGITLRRIRAAITITFPTGFQIKAGELGGWIEKESNLDHDGDAWVSGNAEVSGNADYCCFQSFGSANRTTTAFKCKDGKIIVNCGCFSGNIEDFAKAVERTHGDSKYGREYKAMIELIKVKFGIEDEQH